MRGFKHILVFLYPSREILKKLGPQLAQLGVAVLALERGVNPRESVDRYRTRILHEAAKMLAVGDAKTPKIQLTFWIYEKEYCTDADNMMGELSIIAPIFTIPEELFGSVYETISFILKKFEIVQNYLNIIDTQVVGRRKTTILLLPPLNFRSDILNKFLHDFGIFIKNKVREHPGVSYTTFNDDKSVVAEWLDKWRRKFIDRHRWRPDGISQSPCYHDLRGYAFQPTMPNADHGKPHPTDNPICYLRGRFRFGVSMVSGFHYDVQPLRLFLHGYFYHCDGREEFLAESKYVRANIFPNDHIILK